MVQLLVTDCKNYNCCLISTSYYPLQRFEILYFSENKKKHFFFHKYSLQNLSRIAEVILMRCDNIHSVGKVYIYER